MDTAIIIELMKARIGISSTIRDTYLIAIVEGIVSELEDEKGIVLSEENNNHVMFIVDYATWRYQNRDSDSGMPKNLHWRLRNMFVHDGGAKP
ncbi:MAG TPA: hypothetical protein GX707_12805 [Epulopiscium sp.]|nr:hypothetical protein [Candidatus Epulonipiscium sp.]